jgi:hypothetical protein
MKTRASAPAVPIRIFATLIARSCLRVSRYLSRAASVCYVYAHAKRVCTHKRLSSAGAKCARA